MAIVIVQWYLQWHPKGLRFPDLLVAEWTPSDTGGARFYRLTPKGRAQPREQTEAWARLAEAGGLILGTAGGGAR